MENNNQIPPNILDRLRKLMALKEGTDVEAEQENAALRIQELLMKYNLDPSTLDLSQKENKPDIIESLFDLSPLLAPNESDWIESLVAGIAEVNYCAAITYMGLYKNKKRGVKMAIIGKELNIQIVWYTCEQLINRMRANSRKRFSEYRGSEKRNTYLRGYLRGAALSIYQKLKKAHQENLDTNNQYAVMVTGNKLALREAMIKFHPNIRPANSSALSSNHGYNQGREDGKSMGPNKGLETNVHGTKLLK